MGSSKKSKDKDRKKRKRERSRSRDRKDRHHRHHKHKKHKRIREERSPSISLSDLSDLEPDFDVQKVYQEPPARQHVYVPPPLTPPLPSPPPPPSFTPPPPIEPTGGKEESLSVEDTNKIRARLGLKPLQVAPEIKRYEESYAKDGQEEEEEQVYKAGEEVHRPAENLRDKIQVEKLREKIAAQREKRRLKERMGKVKTLGESEEEEDLTLWVNKSRKLEKERKEAEKRNKMLEELDAQFGVGELVEEDLTQTKKRMYDTRDLGGLRVQHDTERFSEGQTTILTLKDSNILEGDEDTLVNVNIEDSERAEKNLKRKKAKPDEPEYEAPEVDEFGNIIEGSLLTKYDEEIEGERKKSFRIGSRGQGVDEDTDSAFKKPDKASKLNKLRKLTSLDGPAMQLATEYLTPSEMVSFKKKKKKRKRKMLRADDLEPVEDAAQHLGSRAQRRNQMMGMEYGRFPPGVYGGGNRVKSLRELMEDEEDLMPQVKEEEKKAEDPPPNQEVDDDSENEKDMIELQEALTRSRRAKQNAQKKTLATEPESVSDTLSSVKKRLKSEDDASMTLNLTDEFCRSLGDIPTYGLSGNRADEDAVLLPDAPPKPSESWDTHGAWEEVNIEDKKVEIASERNVPILEEEPDTGKGVVNALRLAVKKGYLEKGNEKKPANATLQHLRAVHYSIEDKAVEDERRGRGGDRYMGPTMDFKEKDTYKPDVKLEYVDDEGRKLNAKEAFRYLSHKFHGKGSGKNKLEKRMKKWQEELLMKHMSSSDTPLQTLERQKEKQKQLGAAYLVLSGSKTHETLEVKK